MTYKKLSLIGAACVALLSAGTAQATELINESFDSVAGLGGDGWVLLNNSAAVGTQPNWFQGNPGVFGSFSGAPSSYIGANFDNATAEGTLDMYLISPSFSLEQEVTVSFYARADMFPQFFDQIAWAGNTTAGATAGDFSGFTTPTTLTDTWTEYTLVLPAQGLGSVGRFAINYFGAADDSNYIGIDSFTVTAVPEPMTWLMLSAGLAGLAGARKRRLSQSAAA